MNVVMVGTFWFPQGAASGARVRNLALNLRRVCLEVLETNRRAQELYARLGFVVEGRLRQHQLKGGCNVDVILMGLLREEYSC